MLFGSGAKFVGLFATHPPLAERIRALDPSFRESDYPVVTPRSLSDTMAEDSVSAMAPGAATPGPISAELPQSLVDSAGRPDPQHVAFAQHLRESIPESLHDAAHSVELAFLLVFALLIDRIDGRAVADDPVLTELAVALRVALSAPVSCGASTAKSRQ